MNKYVGYPTDNPCDVCGSVDKCQEEPRFGYTVCKEHYDVRPVDIDRT